ncbi:DNA modification methylase [Sphingomonas sp. BK235]|uniref:DNA modification methylase n=1 Tax=Sphingomonas sp. BK235 TaxID=2512131 RepID=UPI0010488720|nr:DNA modification methylase [Sphingomonas sp. BK235]TCP31358.1 DNA methylase [Sphingomonas sp. BK235]
MGVQGRIEQEHFKRKLLLSSRGRREHCAAARDQVATVGEGAAAKNATSLKLRSIEHIKVAKRRARRTTPAQLRRVTQSVRQYGIVAPVLIDAAGAVINGHIVVEAARELGISMIPVVEVTHLDEAAVRGLLSAAAAAAGLTHANTCVWNKGSGGMGGLYRSTHELILVFCNGATVATNNVALGRHGRDRCNVWNYPGANRRGTSAAKALKLHATPKPVAMVEDALCDVSNRGDIVLDPFLGSGTTLIAAHPTGRIGRFIERRSLALAARVSGQRRRRKAPAHR